MRSSAQNPTGYCFSDCRKFRFLLWEIWNQTGPLVMFIGLNPSTDKADKLDQTVESVKRIAKANGYGGFYMANCFALVTNDPNVLEAKMSAAKAVQGKNDKLIAEMARKCADVVFAWGSFAIVRESGRAEELIKMFPQAKALIINKDGSPRHPLYIKRHTFPVPFQLKSKQQAL